MYERELLHKILAAQNYPAIKDIIALTPENAPKLSEDILTEILRYQTKQDFQDCLVALYDLYVLIKIDIECQYLETNDPEALLLGVSQIFNSTEIEVDLHEGESSNEMDRNFENQKRLINIVINHEDFNHADSEILETYGKALAEKGLAARKVLDELIETETSYREALVEYIPYLTEMYEQVQTVDERDRIYQHYLLIQNFIEYSEAIDNIIKADEYTIQRFAKLPQWLQLEQVTLHADRLRESVANTRAAGSMEADYARYAIAYEAFIRWATSADNRALSNSIHQELRRTQRVVSEQESRTLDHYAIQPIQRLPRYLILLEDYAKHSMPSDCHRLGPVITQMKTVVEGINESKRERENQAVIEEVAPLAPLDYDKLIKQSRSGKGLQLETLQTYIGLVEGNLNYLDNDVLAKLNFKICEQKERGAEEARDLFESYQLLKVLYYLLHPTLNEQEATMFQFFSTYIETPDALLSLLSTFNPAPIIYDNEVFRINSAYFANRFSVSMSDRVLTQYIDKLQARVSDHDRQQSAVEYYMRLFHLSFKCQLQSFDEQTRAVSQRQRVVVLSQMGKTGSQELSPSVESSRKKKGALKKLMSKSSSKKSKTSENNEPLWQAMIEFAQSYEFELSSLLPRALQQEAKLVELESAILSAMKNRHPKNKIEAALQQYRQAVETYADPKTGIVQKIAATMNESTHLQPAFYKVLCHGLAEVGVINSIANEIEVESCHAELMQFLRKRHASVGTSTVKDLFAAVIEMINERRHALALPRIETEKDAYQQCKSLVKKLCHEWHKRQRRHIKYHEKQLQLLQCALDAFSRMHQYCSLDFPKLKQMLIVVRKTVIQQDKSVCANGYRDYCRQFSVLLDGLSVQQKALMHVVRAETGALPDVVLEGYFTWCKQERDSLRKAHEALLEQIQRTTGMSREALAGFGNVRFSRAYSRDSIRIAFEHMSSEPNDKGDKAEADVSEQSTPVRQRPATLSSPEVRLFRQTAADSPVGLHQRAFAEMSYASAGRKSTA